MHDSELSTAHKDIDRKENRGQVKHYNTLKTSAIFNVVHHNSKSSHHLVALTLRHRAQRHVVGQWHPIVNKWRTHSMTLSMEPSEWAFADLYNAYRLVGLLWCTCGLFERSQRCHCFTHTSETPRVRVKEPRWQNSTVSKKVPSKQFVSQHSTKLSFTCELNATPNKKLVPLSQMLQWEKQVIISSKFPDLNKAVPGSLTSPRDNPRLNKHKKY